MPWTDKLPVILSLNDCFKGRQDNNFKVIAAFARFALYLTVHNSISVANRSLHGGLVKQPGFLHFLHFLHCFLRVQGCLVSVNTNWLLMCNLWSQKIQDIIAHMFCSKKHNVGERSPMDKQRKEKPDPDLNPEVQRFRRRTYKTQISRKAGAALYHLFQKKNYLFSISSFRLVSFNLASIQSCIFCQYFLYCSAIGKSCASV